MKSRKLFRVALVALVALPLLAAGLSPTSAGRESGRPAGSLPAAQGRLALDAQANASALPPDSAVALAEQHVRANLASLGLTDADISEWRVSDRYVTKHNGVTHVYFTQRLGGVEVFGGVLNVNVARDGRVVSVGNRFVPRLSERANTRTPLL
nr:hypothetical protein [Acidobacteriota bacterium]